MTWFAENSFSKNIIYTGFENYSKQGFRAPFFYLHGELETLAGYDCFNCTPELLRRLLKNDVNLATAIIGEEKHNCLVFSQFNTSYKEMRGYVVLLSNLEDIKDALDNFPNSYSPCGGDTVDEYLQQFHPEVFKLLRNKYLSTKK